MKRVVAILAWIGSVLIIFSLINVNDTAEASVKKIAVGTFAYERYDRYGLGRLACANLESRIFNGLVRNKNYQVVERTQLDQILRELGLQNSGVVDSSQAIEIGKLSGADYTVMGKVLSAEPVPFNNIGYSGIKGKVTFEMHIVDNKTGVVLDSEILSGNASQAVGFELINKLTEKDYLPEDMNFNANNLIADACREIGDAVIERVNQINPMTGIVLSINENKRVYISLGYSDGVKKEDKYIVYREGAAITDPRTGEVLAVEKDKLAVLEIEDVQLKYSIAKISKKKGEFKRGDKIERGE